MASTSEPTGFPELDSLGLSPADRHEFMGTLQSVIPEAGFGTGKALEVARNIRLSEKLEAQPSKNGLQIWAGYATVAIALSVVIAVLSWRTFDTARNTSSVFEKTYSTRSGQRASVRLADGSRVTLGPASILRIRAAAPNSSQATVDISGEALFNVVHSAKHPFVVTAQGVTTRVLGTEFVVRAYDASHVRVAVRDGRVAVRSPIFTPDAPAIVAAGEAVSVTPNLPLNVTPISDLATEFAWANGELVLRNVPLGEAFVRLSRWYALDFRVRDSSLLKARVTATFPATFNRAEIDILAEAIGARVTRSAGAVTFSAAP